MNSPGGLRSYSASKLLLALLVGDLLLLGFYVYATIEPTINSLPFSPENDRGYPEMFQYLKWCLIIVMFFIVAWKRRYPSYIVWALVFTYFLLDDAFRIHERFGGVMAEYVTFTPPLGLRAQDIGEFTIVALAGTILLIAIAFAYNKGSPLFRAASKDILLLIAGLVFFGVIVDMAHISIFSFIANWKLDYTIGLIEDGGEMIMASLIAWYTCLLMLRDDHSNPSLVGFLLNLLPFNKAR